VTSTAKIFKTGRSQAVRLPMAYRFDTTEVFIRRDATTGDVILSSKPSTSDGFLQVRSSSSVPADFLNRSERDQGGEHNRDPFEAWCE
jgi:antitoxin VapB